MPLLVTPVKKELTTTTGAHAHWIFTSPQKSAARYVHTHSDLIEERHLLPCEVHKKEKFSISRMDFSCKTCSKKFNLKRNLTRHEKIIHGEKLFLCDQCDESFTRNDSLKRHQKQHKGKAHTCNNCRKEFCCRDKFMEHQIQCEGKLLKRKREQDDSGPATKKVRGENQVGESKPENHVEEENDNPCRSTTAFEGSLKKIAMKPRNNQKQDMTRFLHGKIKSILNHLSKELVELVKPKPNGEDITTEAHFCSSCMRTVDQHELYNQLEEAKQAATQAMVLERRKWRGIG